MSDPHDREPVSQEVIDCWRKNYGLDKRTPAEAARWWHDNLDRKAPAAVVAALGIALDDLDMLRAEIERLRAAADAVLKEAQFYGACYGTTKHGRAAMESLASILRPNVK